MRILFVTPNSVTGGGARWLHNVATELSNRGHTCNIKISQYGHPGTIFHHLFEPFFISPDSPNYDYREPDYARTLAETIDAGNYDILVIEREEQLPVVWELSARLRSRKTKVVLVCHTMDMPLERNVTGILDKVDVFIAVSTKVGERLRSVGAPVKVIQNAVVEPPSMGFNVRQFLRVPDDALFVGYIGRVHPGKNIELIIRLAQVVPEIYCGIFGKGERFYWEKLFGEPVVSTAPTPNIRVFTGDIFYVGDWYRALDVFVLPSLQEGFPLSPMEALLCGTRVAMTPVSDYPDVFYDAVSFFGPDDVGGALEAIRSAPPAEVGAAIVREQYSLPKMVDYIEQCLESIALG